MDEKAKEILERLEAEIAALKGKLASVEAEMLSLRAAAERPVEAPETAAPVDLSDVVELPDDMPEAIAEVAEMPAEDPEIPAADAEMPADLPEETPRDWRTPEFRPRCPDGINASTLRIRRQIKECHRKKSGRPPRK